MKISRYIVLALLTLLAIQGTAQTKTHSTKHAMKTKKVLFVVTSTAAIPASGTKTGLWIEEFTSPYYFLSDKGVEITIASPAGGKTPIDPKSTQPEYSTPSVKRFFTDAAAQQKLDHALTLDAVNATDYDAIFYPGGHGPMWDLPDNKLSIQLIQTFYAQGKPVALVCHAPAALKNVVDKNGEPLVKGKKVTGYSNSEEVAGQSTNAVPFMLEDMLKEKGGLYSKANDWQPLAITDGLLITGQNPASAEPVAQEILKQLSHERKK